MGMITMKQYNDAMAAGKAGNQELKKQILAEEYGVDSTIIDVEVEPQYTDDDVIGDIAAGLATSEIAAKYGISVQKVGSIKRKAK